MELNKNYPWLGSLKISNQEVQNWREKTPEISLTFWVLKNKNIDQKRLF